MSINLLTKFISSCIALLLILISAFIVWVWHEMDKPYQINQSYHAIKSDIESNISLSLQQYLTSGNANDLLEAENKLLQIQKKPIHWLNQAQSKAIKLSISQLKQAIMQVRAAGKLAANSEILLVNNEEERQTLVADFTNLTQQSTVSVIIKNQYQQQLLILSQQLHRLTLLRQRYLQYNNDSIKELLLEQNFSIENNIKQLALLPNLNLFMSEEVDEFSFDEPEKIDLTVQNINELSSIRRRSLIPIIC